MSGLDHNRLVAATIAKLKADGFALDAAPKLASTGKSGVEVFVDALALATVEEIENHYSGTSGTGTDSILNSLVGDGVPKRTGTTWAMVNDLLTQSAADLRYATPLSVAAAVATRQAASNDLTAIAEVSGIGYLKKIASGVWNAVSSIPWSDLTGIPSVTAGAGLSGGGLLTAGITLAVAFAGTGAAATVARSDHSHSGYATTSHAASHHWDGADPLVGQSISGLRTNSVPQFAGLTLRVSSTLADLNFQSLAGSRRMVGRWDDPNDNWDLFSCNDDGSPRITRVRVPRSSSLAVQIFNGLTVTGTTTISTSLTGLLKATAGVIAAASASDLPSHTHVASQISDSTALGRSLLLAVDASAARSAIALSGWATKTYTNGSTTDVSEGSNLYYTDARARAAITATSPIIATAGVISHSAADGSLHVPATGTTSNGKWLRAGATAGSVSWQTLYDTDLPSHTHSSNAISDSTVLGRQLLTIADAPAARYALFLTEWATKSYTNGSTTDVAEGSNLYYTDARARAAITAASPIIATAGVISHSATDGNLHVPATGTTNNGKWLRAGATAGSISWQSLVVGDLPSHTHTASQISDSTTIGRSLLLAADAAAARSAIALTGWATKTYTNGSTTDVSEGSNLYYTDARARAAITATSPIIATAGVISHSAADGNLHVPATGTTNNGKWLRAGATAGSASWQTFASGDLPTHASLHHWNGADPLAGQSIAGLLTSSVPQFAGLLLTGNIRVNQDTLFAANSVDGNEQSALAICGGLGSSAANGAFIYVRGNERPTSGGTLSLVAGDGIQGNIEFSTGTLLRATITKAGEFNVSSGALRVGSISGFLAATSGLLRAGTASDLPGAVATLGSLANGDGVLRNTGAGVLSWQACLPIQSYSTLGIARASGTSVYAYQILADTGIGVGDARGLNWRGGFFGNQPDWWGFRQDASLTSSFKPFVIGDYLSDLYTIDRFGSYVHLLNGSARITTSLSIGSLTGLLKANAGLVSVASASDLPVHAARHHFGGGDQISGQLLSGLRVTEAPKFAGLVLENLVSDSAYLRFHDSSGVLKHQIRRFSNANGGGLAIMDGGSGFRITIPSLSTLPVEIDGGLKLFSGDLTLNTGFNGILKAVAGVVSVASLSDIPVPAGRIPFGGAAGMTSDPGFRFGDPAPNILYAPYINVESMLYASLFNLGSSAAFLSMGDTVLAIGDGVTAPRVRFPVTSTSKAFQVDGLATFANIDAVQIDADLLTGDVQASRDEITSGGSRTLPQANQVGKSARFCAGIGPGTYTVTVFNPASELIFYRSRTTGVRAVATSLDVVDSATEFVCHAIGRWTAVGY